MSIKSMLGVDRTRSVTCDVDSMLSSFQVFEHRVTEFLVEVPI